MVVRTRVSIVSKDFQVNINIGKSVVNMSNNLKIPNINYFNTIIS